MNSVTYAAKQALLPNYYKNDAIESIINVTPTNTVQRLLLNNGNPAALTNLNKKLYEAQNRHVGTKYG